jgi:hypothetical protein
MSFVVQIICGERFVTRVITGWNRTGVIDFDGLSVKLINSPKPIVIFEPPLNRNFVFRGVAEEVSSRGIIDISDGEFSFRSNKLSIFGKVNNSKLKEPDNSLV